MGELSVFQQLAIWALPVLFAITVHETAHGWMAYRLGDRTARMLGRLTLNPLRHIDPIGTILVPAVIYLTTGFLFGWAKPVPVTWENLKHPRRDMAWIAAAGPLSNLLMVLLWALVARLGVALGPVSGQFLLYLGIAGIYVNTILMVLNLLPWPPLDGSKVVSALLPGPLAWKYSRLETWGLLILMVLFVTGTLGYLLWPLIVLMLDLVQPMTGINEVMFRSLLVNLLK